MAEESCVACASPETQLYFIKKTSSGSYPIRRCRRCRSAFVWPRPTEGEMEAYYRNEAYARRPDETGAGGRDGYHPTGLADARRMVGRCRRLTAGTDFLDIGAGFGEFSQAARENGFRVQACEPNPNARRAFRERNGFEPDAAMFDENYASGRTGRFDVVFLSHVLEHITDPAAFVGLLPPVLREGGLAAVAVPHFGSALSRLQGRKDVFISPPEHLNFFSRRGLVLLFERQGFRLEGLNTVSKVPRRKYEQRIRIPLVRTAVWRGLYAGLSFWNLFGRGMVINAYFRKGPERAADKGLEAVEE